MMNINSRPPKNVNPVFLLLLVLLSFSFFSCSAPEDEGLNDPSASSITLSCLPEDPETDELITVSATLNNISLGDHEYIWSFVNKPAMSSASLTANDADATFSADVTGDYEVFCALINGSATYNSKVIVSVNRTSVSVDNANLSSITLSQAALNPEFHPDTTDYSATVPNNVNSLTVTPTATGSEATITVNGTDVVSGNPSPNIDLLVGDNTITIVVTAEDLMTIKTYNLTITRSAPPNDDASLSDLNLSDGRLVPTFSSGITAYNSKVENTIDSVTITPTANDINATIEINGVEETSALINLSVGDNTITIIVTAEDNTTKNTYTITITRDTPVSGDATLSGLLVSSGILDPTFDAAISTYNVTVENETSSVTVTPTANHSSAVIEVDEVLVNSGEASGLIDLNVGDNTITTFVTAEDMTTTKSYVVTVHRKAPLSTNANLLNLMLSSGTLDPSFDSATIAYTASVDNSIDALTIVPAISDSRASIKVNNIDVSSDTSSDAIDLIVGDNIISIEVTAEDLITTKTYTLTVTRTDLLSGDADLSNLVLSNGTLDPTFDADTISYGVQVDNEIDSITVKPTASSSAAIIKVNDIEVDSGNPSGAIALVVGSNSISVKVTAEDSTMKEYSIDVSRDSAPIWHEVTVPGRQMGVGRWRDIVTTADGQTILAVDQAWTDYPGYMHVSTNGGKTWSKRTSAGNRMWSAIAASDDGSVIAATVDGIVGGGDVGGYIYVSTDGGLRWTEYTGPEQREWSDVYISADGSKIFTVVDEGPIYRSLDSGASWTMIKSGTTWWRSIDASADGNFLIAASWKHVYTSTDGGENWNIEEDLPTYNEWMSVSSSPNGQYLAVAAKGDGSSGEGVIYTSADGGATWIDRTLSAGVRDWSAIAVSPDGSKLVAGETYGNIHVSIDGGETWEVKTPGGLGIKSVTMSQDGSAMFAVETYGAVWGSTDGGNTWSKKVNIESRAWKIACSADGEKISVIDVNKSDEDDYIYISADGGESWTIKTSSDTGQKDWSSIFSSADGNVIAAVEKGGYVRVSTNGGGWFSRKSNLGVGDWSAVAVSADGQTILAIENPGGIHRSTDGGDNWDYRGYPYGWYDIVISEDGNKAAAAYDYRVYLSSDGGYTWSYSADIGTGNFLDITSSSDGTKLAVVDFNDVDGGYIYTSTDSGITWTERTSAGLRSWIAIASSSDGQSLIAADVGGYIYKSTDGGSTWVPETDLGEKYWYSVAISADGKKLMAGVSNAKSNYLYIKK